jgi:hypothetical protein
VHIGYINIQIGKEQKLTEELQYTGCMRLENEGIENKECGSKYYKTIVFNNEI